MTVTASIQRALFDILPSLEQMHEALRNARETDEAPSFNRKQITEHIHMFLAESGISMDEFCSISLLDERERELVDNGVFHRETVKKLIASFDSAVGAQPRPLDATMRERMTRHTYSRTMLEWDKANDRLYDDPDGAITAAKSLIESSCKLILSELNIDVSKSATLQKLYGEASKAIGIAPSGQQDQYLRMIFSASHQAMQAVAEIRNKYGDSHGKLSTSARPSRAQAELAVHLSGAVCCFLVSEYESYLSATRRTTAAGEVILRFDKATVWRLVDHAATAAKSALYYGEEVGRCLLLVGDTGIYLMSNGCPPMSEQGQLLDESDSTTARLCAHAEGCGVFDEVDDWWRLHNLIDGGSDFSHPIPVDGFRAPLTASLREIVIVAGRDSYQVMSDAEFSRRLFVRDARPSVDGPPSGAGDGL